MTDTSGWKILLTSRNEGVALRADPTCFTFKTDFLTLEDSWTLFRRTAFPNTTENKVDEEMEAMGKQMIKHCGGLPLAVKVLGGLLARQYTLRQWTRVYENIKPHIIGGASLSDRNISSVYHILHMSFEELPIYLKHCFLYLGHFPEDYEINITKLSYHWAAEGIPRPMYCDGASIRDVADEYMDELVKRNMVMSKRDSRTSRYETCKLHDMMREICLHQVEEENFLQIVHDSLTASSKSPGNFRRLAIHFLMFDKTLKMKNARLRNLLFIKGGQWKATGLSFTRLQLMRVLDLSHVIFGELPSDIGKLIHLRYLSLYKANVSQLPSTMRNLKQLIYLNLHVICTIYMPNFLNELPELRYLYLPKRLHGNGKMELGNLVNLETLVNFRTSEGSVSDLQGMTHLRDLFIRIRDKGCTMEILSSSLSELRYLENLTIKDSTYGVKGFVLDCVHLRQLVLKIYMPRLPDVEHLPSHLIYLELRGCRLEEDPMPILEKLLHLKEVSLDWNAFCGRRMVCSGSGFPQLHKLELCGLEEWEEWIVEEGSMPVLHTLNIFRCSELKEIPDGLRFITSLKYLRVAFMGERWKERLLEGGEDYYKVQLIPFVTCYVI